MNLQNIILRNLKYLLLLISVIFGMSEVYSSSSVSSVNAYQEGKNIVITYQLSERSNISVYVSTDGGKKYNSIKNISGDFGKNVSSGTKQIIWNVLADYEKFIFSEVCFKVISSNAEAIKNNGHAYVDLGLPSGTLWATCNVGATKPEEYGNYFAWGETQPKKKYDWTTYKWLNGKKYNSITKYCHNFESEQIGDGYGGFVDNKLVLEKSDDVANLRWGGDWHMPTKENLSELYTECTWKWESQNGIKGYKIFSKTNDNSIFLPAAGFYDSDSGWEDIGSDGYYWSSELDISYSYNASILFFWIIKETSRVITKNRTHGLTVRPVIRISNSYNVSFDSNGGEGFMETIVIDYAKFLAVPTNKFTRPGYEFICWNTKADGTGISYEESNKFSVGSDMTLYAQWYRKETNIYHEYVDLGLPSGTLWATMNIGANSPEDVGYFFAWGETKLKAEYSSKTYSCSDEYYYNPDKKKRVVDKRKKLDMKDDAANVNWGNNWRMPTIKELNELMSKCTWIEDKQNAIKGYTVVGPNGKSIFLPNTGYRYGKILKSYFEYWSSSHVNEKESSGPVRAFSLDNFGENIPGRYYGLPVRPVMSRKSGKSYRIK